MNSQLFTGLFEILSGTIDCQVKLELILLIQILSKQKIIKNLNLNEIFRGLLGVINDDSENFEQIFANFLLFCEVDIVKKYVNLLENNKNPSAVNCLLNAFQRACINSDFVEFLKAVKLEKLLFSSFLQVFIEDNNLVTWKALLINTVKLSSLPSLNFTDSEQFSFTPYAEKLRNSKEVLLSFEIELIDCIINSMVDKKLEIIRFPQIIPLFTEFLCQNPQGVIEKNRELLRKIKNSQVCIDLLASHQFLSTVFFYLSQRNDFELWTNCEILCMQLISVHFSMYDLEQWFKVFLACNDFFMKEKVLGVLRTALNKSESSDKAWKYIYFVRDNQVFFDYMCDGYVVGKEFSVGAWVLRDVGDKSVLLALKLPLDTIEISLNNLSVQVKTNDFIIEAPESLKKNVWNCIYISFGASISIYTNGTLQSSKYWKTCKLQKSNKLEKACICNSCIFTHENSGFIGSISSLILFKRPLDPLQIQQYFNSSANISSIECEKDLKDLIYIDLLDNLFTAPNDFSGIYKFQHIPMHKTLKAYGIRRFLLNIHKSITDTETLNEFFSLTKTLIYKNVQNSEIEYFTKDSIRFLSYFLIKSPYSDDICCNIENILEICSDEHANIILNTLITSSKLSEFTEKNKKFYRFIIKKLKNLLELNKESLLILCNIMKNSGLEDFSEELTGFLSSKSESLIIQNLPQVLYYFCSEQQYEIVYNMMVSLKILEIDVIACKSLLACILNMFDSQHPVRLLIFGVDLIFFNKNDQDKEIFKQIVEFIDNNLQSCLSFELIQYFLFIGFDFNSVLKEFRFYFLDIVVKRLAFVSDSKIFELVLTAFQENSQYLYESVVKREAFYCVFPEFLAFAGENCVKFAEYLLENGAENGGFWFIQQFFSVSQDIELFMRLLVKFKADNRICEVIKSFEVLRNKLESNPRTYLAIFHVLESSSSITKFAKESIIQFSLTKQVQTLQSEPLIKDFIITYLNLLISGLYFFRSQSEPFDFLDNFLSSGEISHLNQGILTNSAELEAIEAYLSVYILINLLNYYIIDSFILKEDLLNFIKNCKIPQKLSKFYEKFSKSIQESFYDVICTESVIEINREDIEAKVQARKNSFKEFQQKLSENFEDLDTMSSENFISIQILPDIIPVFFSFFKKIASRPQDIVKYPEKIPSFRERSGQYKNFIEKWMADICDTTWVQTTIEARHRFLSKIIQDYKIYKKSQKKLSFTLQNPCQKTIKIRKIYDKLGRWSTFKSDFPENFKKLKKTVPTQPTSSLNPDKFPPSDQNSESPNISDNSTFPSRENTGNYSLTSLNIYSTYIERIKVEGSFYGKLNISSEFFELIFEGKYKDPDFPGALKFTFSTESKTRIWYPNEFSEILIRRFIHKHSAIEFILKSGKSYFINFFTHAKREEVLKVLKSWNLKTQIKILKKDLDSVVNDWKKGLISNFEYLMLLNKYASRSFNDLSQYPIFPWIISDYETEKFNYEDPNILRKLKYPIGAQQIENHKKLQIKYESWKDDLLKPYHHGSHYSNPGIILYYLVRIEPYSSQAKLLQGGNFDLADRLLTSINFAWKNSVEVFGTDVKELIPEMFFNVWVLENFGNIKLGVMSDGTVVHNVSFPNWASCGWDFIIKHRNLLESSMVSKELHLWIDLIFGFRQNGENGESVLNIFCPPCYEFRFDEFCNTHDSDEIIPMTEQVYHFGQCPLVIFRDKGHVLRDDVGKAFRLYKYFYFNADRDIKFENKEKKFGAFGKVHSMFIVNDGLIIVKTANKLTYLCKFILKDYIEIGNASVDAVLQGYQAMPEGEFGYTDSEFQNKTLKFEYGNQNFALISNKFLVAGLDISNKVKIFDLKGNFLQSLLFHTQFVICVEGATEQIFSGSFDSSIKAWSLDKESYFSSFSFYGHKSPVTHLKLLESFQVIVSVSIKHTILFHDTKNSECLYRIEASILDIDICDHGLIGLVFGNKIQYRGINGEIAAEYEVSEKVHSIKISPCGNFCIEASMTSVVMRDIFRNQRIEKLGEFNRMKIDNIVIHPSEKGIFYLKKLGLEAYLGMFKLISKKILEEQKGIIYDLI